ncbi:hypothetical protein Ccrd_003622, partial [Cynara cardunculus var. scolymus]
MVKDDHHQVLRLLLRSNAFNNTHRRIGVALYGLVFLQAISGLLRPERNHRFRYGNHQYIHRATSIPKENIKKYKILGRIFHSRNRMHRVLVFISREVGVHTKARCSSGE